jgi:hypothetical protein
MMWGDYTKDRLVSSSIGNDCWFSCMNELNYRRMNLMIDSAKTFSLRAPMAEWLCCLACTIKVRCSNRGATRYRMTLDNSGMTVCLGSPNDAHWLSGGTLRQVILLSRATASNSCRKNIGLLTLSPDSNQYRKARYSFFLFQDDGSQYYPHWT